MVVKISVEFPSVASREGPAKVVELARAVESIGFDDLAMFDHVVMGYETDTRRAPMYPSQMPILEALVTLGYVAAVTERVTLSTEVLVLPVPVSPAGVGGTVVQPVVVAVAVPDFADSPTEL